MDRGVGGEARSGEGRDDAVLVAVGKPGIERQHERAIFGALALAEVLTAPWRAAAAARLRAAHPRYLFVGRRTMGAHDAALRGNPLIEQRLHDAPLVARVGESHAVALPVRPSPRELLRQAESRNAGEAHGVARRELPPAFENLRQPLELRPADRRLQI